MKAIIKNTHNGDIRELREPVRYFLHVARGCERGCVGITRLLDVSPATCEALGASCSHL